MNKIKTLIIGESPFNSKEYENLTYNEIEIESEIINIAFIPKLKDKNYDLYNITSYRRILGVLFNKKISNENIFIEYNSKVKKRIKTLAEKNIYLVNQSELKADDGLHLANHKNEIENIICFGSKAAKYIDSFQNKHDIKFNTYYFPHPSGRVQHPFWNDFAEDGKNYSDKESLNIIQPPK